jgi:APA family basic amino acid/polyamine antiporter
MKRTLSRFDVVCIGLNAIVGSGVFALPDDLYRELGIWSPLAFVLCAVGLWPIALCYAEAAGRVDRTGGPYLYASEAFGPQTGFVVGWMCFANSLFSFAAVGSAAAAYLGRLVPALADPVLLKVSAIAMIAAFGALNYYGAKPGALAIDAFTIAKFSVLLVMIVALIPRTSMPDASVTATSTLPPISAFSAAAFMALFAAQGFEVVPVPAGETQVARRNIPFAIISSLIVSSILYVIVQSTLALAYPKLGEVSSTPLADAALYMAPWLGALVTFGGLVSTLGFVSGSALGTPRMLFAAAEDGHLPRGLAALHPRFDSPHQAILATTVVAVLLVIPFDYRSLIGMSNVAISVQYLATCLAVIPLRKRDGATKVSVLGRVAPYLGTAVSIWIVTEASGEELIWAGASLVAGIAWRALTQRKQAR